MIYKAILIGAGDSINEGILEKIEQRKNELSDVAIMPSDRVLKRVLDLGITPEYFPNFFTCITENLYSENLKIDFFKEFFEHEIVKKHAENITIFTSNVFDRFEELHNIGFKKNIDFIRVGKKGRIVKPETPVIQSCGNNVMGLFLMARKLGINEIASIGFDMDFTGSYKETNHDPKNELALTQKELFQTYLDYNKPIYNLTKSGNIHGKGVTDISLEDFLIFI